jgi:hypothetical protein
VETVAKAISKKLRGIPLAIEQASAFLSLGTVEIHHFSEHFEQKFLRDTFTTLPLQYGYSYEKRRTIYAALDMVAGVVEKRSPDSMKLLNIAVLLGPGEIDFSTLATAALPEEYSKSQPSQGSSAAEASLPIIPFWLIGLRDHARDFGTAIQKLEQVSLIRTNRQSG